VHVFVSACVGLGRGCVSTSQRRPPPDPPSSMLRTVSPPDVYRNGCLFHCAGTLSKVEHSNIELGGLGGIARRLRTANGTQNLNVRMFFRNVSSQDGCYFHSHRTQILFWTCKIISAELTAEIVGRRWVRTLASRNLLTLIYLRKYFGQQEKLTARLRTVGWPPRQVLLNLFRQPTKHVTFTNTVVVFRWRSGSNFSTSPRKCQPRVMMRAEVMPIKVEASIPNVQRQ